MKTLIVEAPDGSTTVVDDLNQLRANIDRLHSDALRRNHPTLVTLYEAQPAVVRSLSIAVGSETSMADWADEQDSREPYLSSLGTGGGNERAQFYFGNQWSEFPASVLIPFDDACEAAIRFFNTRDRPDNIKWQTI